MNVPPTRADWSLRIAAKYAARLLVLFAWCHYESTAIAAGYSWGNVNGGSFNNPTNWSPTGVPGVNDFVKFDVNSSAPYTVTLPGSGAFDPVVNHTTRY